MSDDTPYMRANKNVRGRGSGALPKSRFDTIQTFLLPETDQQVATTIFKDTSKTILTTNDSPDVEMATTLNPYRGCEHGCSYCYARPTHEYLGHSAGLDFETKIYAKFEAPTLLRAELLRKSWQPKVIALSGITDCYQPAERKLQITRHCLEVLAEFRNPVLIITKSQLVTRDIDLLSSLARYNAAKVVISLTTMHRDLSRRMEPRASQPDQRLQAIRELTHAGIPVSINVAPVVPGLNDHEIPELLKQAADAGAMEAHYVLLRLPYGVKEIFPDWLEKNYPARKNKILNQIRASRAGQLYQADFETRMTGTGIYAEQIEKIFSVYRSKYGLNKRTVHLSTKHFQRPIDPLPLFDF